jgi:hypothetical protein
MRLRTRLLVVLAVFGVGLFVLGTGAFTTVSAERTVSVNTASDDAALLELTPHGGPNGAYADGSGDELAINFDAVPAAGVNQNATTTLSDVFNITNRGTQTANVYITKNGANAGLVTVENANGARIDGGPVNGVSVPVGESVEVAIIVDTTGQNLADGDTLLNSITIHAEA